MTNFALRFINSQVGSPNSEQELLETERKIKIIQNNQRNTGMKDFPELRSELKQIGERLIEISENETLCLANVISGILTNQSLIDFIAEKLQVEYKKEGEELIELNNFINANDIQNTRQTFGIKRLISVG